MSWRDRHYNREEHSTGGMAGRLMRGPSVVMWLLGINVGVFFLDMLLGSSMRGQRFAPNEWGNFNFDQAVRHWQLWRLITYQFIHANLWHIFGNMLVVYFFGPMMEAWWGSRRFLAYYLLCGMSGALVYSLFVVFAPGVIFDAATVQSGGQAHSELIGASGAGFGILIGCAILYPHQRVMLLIPPIPMSMRTLAIIVMVFVGLGLIFGAANAGGEAAHLGGAALGWLLIKWPNLLGFTEGFGAAAARWKVQRVARAAQRERQREVDELARVDQILDKVRDHGLASLTAAEKRALQRATERQRGR